jgi:LuxR family transcriptional regulator, maltose regulon positive regulatory protein
VRTAPLIAFTDLAAGILAAAGGDHERARPLLEDALDRFDRSSAPFESSQVRIELATSLTALGRTDLYRSPQDRTNSERGPWRP